MARQTVESDPVSGAAWRGLGDYLRGTGDLAGSRAASERSLEIAPGQVFAGLELAVTCLRQGDLEAARGGFARSGAAWIRFYVEALAEHAAGRTDASRLALEALVTGFADDAAYQVAQAHAWRGEMDAAFAWLERARPQRDPGIR